MITKTVIKDYVAKRCPYLASLELEDKSLVQLLEKSAANREKYQELILESQEQGDTNEEGGEKDLIFDLPQVLRDYPHLKNKIKYFDKHQKKNKVEELIEKYNDDQIVSKISRTYFENIYGKENCVRCDVNADGSEFINQEAMVQMTQSALADTSKKVLFEPQIEHVDLRARADVLIRNDDGSFSMVEVKGSNTVFRKSIDKKTGETFDRDIVGKYLYDALFQYHVYTSAGMNIKSVAFMFTNREFEIKKHTYPTADEELNDLFILKNTIDLKDGTKTLVEYFDSEDYAKDKTGHVQDDLLIENIIFEIRQIAKQSGIVPHKTYFCCKGPVCPFISMCFGEEAEGPNSVFKLTRWGIQGGYHKRTKRLLEDGIDKISDIASPEAYDFHEFNSDGKRYNAYTQIRYQKGEISEKYIIDISKIKSILLKQYLNDETDYLIFFDFESFQYPIPLVEHVGPWKQLVSQYSMHICKKGYDLSKHDFAKGVGGGVNHFEFIANPDESGYENPSIPLYTTLKTQLESVGIDPYAKNYKVVVFNKSFEQGRMREFGRDFVGKADLDLLRFVANFNENVVDLLDFFTSGSIYGRDFNGRASLKVVQPTLGADKDVLEYYKKILPFDLAYSLDYHKDDKCLVYNGGICLDLYKSLLVRAHLGDYSDGLSTKDLLAEALAYCKIDSWGTVIIYDIIKNIYLGNLKLDALIK